MYAGGSFGSVGYPAEASESRNRIVALDIANESNTGTPTAWDPNASSTMYAITASSSPEVPMARTAPVVAAGSPPRLPTPRPEWLQRS